MPTEQDPSCKECGKTVRLVIYRRNPNEHWVCSDCANGIWNASQHRNIKRGSRMMLNADKLLPGDGPLSSKGGAV